MFGDLFLTKEPQNFFLDGKIRINSNVYAKILKFCKKEMDCLGVQYLMEDGAKCHSCNDSCKVKIWESNFKKTKLQGSYFWPGNSPDLNPIENAWSSLKSAVEKMKKKPKDKESLKRSLRYYWKKDEENGLHAKYVNSMKERMKKLKKKNYLNIGY